MALHFLCLFLHGNLSVRAPDTRRHELPNLRDATTRTFSTPATPFADILTIFTPSLQLFSPRLSEPQHNAQAVGAASDVRRVSVRPGYRLFLA
ncbi:hypothetical protein E4U42_000869 [Claviceps africana]|uniref:Secreted protein n=1 Tax=Claviceps africana TaxID=83212 RepID=A0A8K0IZH7_9HYPO|nr:hypothetical protein E4U42_000869 [Claviceps africana]